MNSTIYSLGYLVLPRVEPRSGPDSSLYSRNTQILFGTWFPNSTFEEQLEEISEVFYGLKKNEPPRRIKQSLPFNWSENERYDSMVYLGDRSSVCIGQCVWTFDLVNDVAYHVSYEGTKSIRISVLRKRPEVSFADFEEFCDVPKAPLSNLEQTFWKPRVAVDERLYSYVGRLLTDFNHQWRHVFRRTFNYATRRMFAQAVIKFCTLDFRVREFTVQSTNSSMLRGSILDRHTSTLDEAQWEPLLSDVLEIDGLTVILAETIEDGVQKAQRHAGANSPTGDVQFQGLKYVILTISHVALGCVDASSNVQCTFPEPLFNGDREECSELAIRYLLWAFSRKVTYPMTRLHHLPLEIQDLILSHEPAIPTAYLSCQLGLGTAFSWRYGNQRLRLVEKTISNLHIPEEGYTFSQIWFKGSGSGMTRLLYIHGEQQ